MRIVLANITAIYQRELQSYFASPLAYSIAGIFWFLSGFFFILILQNWIANAAALTLQQQSLDMSGLILQDFLGVLSFLSLFILPALSMGLYTEERKRGTLELLATSPMTNWAVAVGKWLAVLTFFITLLVPLMAYEAIVLGTSTPPLPLALPLLGHLGLILMAAAILSLGMFISSLTESIVVSAILTFTLVLLLWVIDGIARIIPGPVGEALSHLSLLKHYNTLSQGMIDLGGWVLFASYIVLGVFLTAQSIETLRFQRS